MTIPRFFLTKNQPGAKGAGRATDEPVNALDLKPGDTLELNEPGVTNQIRNVLRMKAGARLCVLDNSGNAYNCSITNVSAHSVACVVEGVEYVPPPAVRVHIGLSLIKGERFEWALEKLTEVGVSKITPLITSRTVVKFDTDDAKGAQKKLDRWTSILRESAEQSERGTIPHIVLPEKIEDFIKRLTDGGTPDTAFICSERLQGDPLKDIFSDQSGSKKYSSGTTDGTIILLVGPEGGFTDREIGFAGERGIKPVSLGRQILRAETAAIISVAQVIWALEK